MKPARSQQRTQARRRILILDDHPITRYGLIQLINQEPDLLVCGEAETAQRALQLVPSVQPDLVVADLTMPGKSGLDFIRDLRALHPRVPVVVMSMHDESIFAERVLRAGGRGYVMKSEGGARLLEAIRQVLQGQVCVSAKISSTLLDALSRRLPSACEASPCALTNREFEVFQLIGQGLATREIGERLHLSVKTIETHRRHIKEKLSLRTGPELVRHSVRWAAAQQLI